MKKKLLQHKSAFKNTEELLLSKGTRFIESVTGHRKLKYDFYNDIRSLDDYLLYYIAEGSINCWINKFKTCLKPGMIIWLMPETTHRVWCDPDNKKRAALYFFRFRLLNEQIKDDSAGFLLCEKMQETESLFLKYYKEAYSANRNKNNYLKSLLYLILSDCKNSFTKTAKSEKKLNPASYNTIFKYTKDNIKNWPSPAALAEEIGYSVDYFSRIFKQSFGSTPQHWLVQQRIKAIAEEMENNPQTISEIAYNYGYKDIYFFSRQFKQIFGVSPRKWRSSK